MNIPPLCIIQARYNSTRLPGKMLLRLGDETLIERAWRIACEAFGKEHVVVAVPGLEGDTPLREELRRIGATFDSTFYGREDNVLGRFVHVASQWRWELDSVIVRYTPDDPFKDVESLRSVAGGSRIIPVVRGGEAFTLHRLYMAEGSIPRDASRLREHLTYTFNPDAEPTPEGIWTIDTQDDLDGARAWMAAQ